MTFLRQDSASKLLKKAIANIANNKVVTSVSSFRDSNEEETKAFELLLDEPSISSGTEGGDDTQLVLLRDSASLLLNNLDLILGNWSWKKTKWQRKLLLRTDEAVVDATFLKDLGLRQKALVAVLQDLVCMFHRLSRENAVSQILTSSAAAGRTEKVSRANAVTTPKREHQRGGPVVVKTEKVSRANAVITPKREQQRGGPVVGQIPVGPERTASPPANRSSAPSE